MVALAGPCPIRQVRRALPSKPHPPKFSPLILTTLLHSFASHNFLDSGPLSLLGKGERGRISEGSIIKDERVFNENENSCIILLVCQKPFRCVSSLEIVLGAKCVTRHTLVIVNLRII